MSRVLFNATAALQGTSGAVHTIGLLTNLASLASQHEFVLLTTRDQTFVRDRLEGVVTSCIADAVYGGGLARTLRLQRALGSIAASTGANLIYNKGNFHAVGVDRQVCFVENSNPFSTLRLGEPFGYRLRNRLLRVMAGQALTHAAAAIFPTEHTRRLVTSRSRTSVPTFIVPYGWELPAPAAALPAERPYLLCVSSVLPYKNLPLAVEALKLLRHRGVFDDDLVIVGVSGVAGGGYYHRVLQSRIEELGQTSHIRMIPPVGPEELSALYCGAACVVMPSLEESFGIPLIEAMGLGTPVAAARVDGPAADEYFMSFEEICGDAAEYFDPFDAGSCADAVARTCQPARRDELTDAGRRRAKMFSWRSAAERTLAVLDAVI